MTATHIEIIVNDDLYEKLVEELLLSDRPPALSLNHSGFASGTNAGAGTVECRGVYVPLEHTVYLSTGNASLQRERLIELTRHLLVTFLHEMRHAHQHTHWSAEQLVGGVGYWDSHVEVDARAWSEGAAERYRGLVRVQRRPVGGRTGFGRMQERAGRRLACES